MRGNKLFVMRLTCKARKVVPAMDGYFLHASQYQFSNEKIALRQSLILQHLWHSCEYFGVFIYCTTETPPISFFATRGVLLLSQVRMIIICFNSRYANALGRHSLGLSLSPGWQENKTHLLLMSSKLSLVARVHDMVAMCKTKSRSEN